MPARDGPPRQALGVGGADVVLVDHVEHAGAGDAGDDGQRDRGQGGRGQDEVQERVQRRVRPTHDEAVEHVEPGRVLGEQARVLPPRRGQPRQLHREHVLEDEAEEEDGDRHPEQRGQHGRGVHPRQVTPRGHVAERDPQADRDEQREQRELDGRGEEPDQLLGDGLAGGGGDAEVPSHQTAEVGEILLEDRPVEAVQRVELRDRVGGGPFAQQRLRGAAGQGSHPGEEQHAEPEEDRDQQQQPPDDESEHGDLSARSGVTCARGWRSGRPPPARGVLLADHSAASTVIRLKLSFWTGLGSKPSTPGRKASAGSVLA